MTEPVLLVAAAVVGLERALHAWPPRARLGAQVVAPGARARLRRPRSLRPSPRQRQSYPGAPADPRLLVPHGFAPACRSRRPVVRSEVASIGPAPIGA
jgi:hypothetical protein